MNKRRQLLIGSGVVVAAWHKPVINSIVTPAHAQMSPPVVDPEQLCPMIVIGNVVLGPVSGTFVPPVCSVTFDVLSGTAGTPLTIVEITNTTAADTTIVYDGFGEVTDTTGSRVVWRGPAPDAPFCSDLTVINDVTFTVTATCAAVDEAIADGAVVENGTTFTQDFTLSEILA